MKGHHVSALWDALNSGTGHTKSYPTKYWHRVNKQFPDGLLSPIAWECYVLSCITCQRSGRSRLDAKEMEQGVAIPSSVYCTWLTDTRSKPFLWHHSFEHLYLMKPQIADVLISKGRCSSPNWTGGIYSFLETWLPEKKSVVARRKSEINFFIWPHFSPAGSLLSGCKSHICSAGLNTHRTVLSIWQGMSHLHDITLFILPARSGCRQTGSWEWSLGCATSQTIPVDCQKLF